MYRLESYHMDTNSNNDQKTILTSYSPYNVFNVYSRIIQNYIEECGYQVIPIKRILRNPKLFFNCYIVNFNWFEEAPDFFKFLPRYILLILLKLFNKKIIFTLHNKHPHNLVKNYWTICLSKKMCDISNVIIGHCPETEKIIAEINPENISKFRLIPHPNYIESYKVNDNPDLRKIYGYKQDDIVFLFLGTISPYKNVEMLIDVFHQIQQPFAKLLIAGNACDCEYGKYIQQKVLETTNIQCDIRYIPDDEIPNYYSICDVSILPYQKSSYLNSGVVYLSFSLKRTVISPMIGTINMIPNKQFVYSYDYASEDEHRKRIYETINRVLADVQNNPYILRTYGYDAYQYMKKYHSKERIKSLYKQTYDSLC